MDISLDPVSGTYYNGDKLSSFYEDTYDGSIFSNGVNGFVKDGELVNGLALNGEAIYPYIGYYMGKIVRNGVEEPFAWSVVNDKSAVIGERLYEILNPYTNANHFDSITLSTVGSANQITSLFYLFFSSECPEINLSGFDTSNVEILENVFYLSHNLKNINVTTWNTEKVTNAQMAFGDSEWDAGELNLSQWNLCNIENMSWMFASSSIKKLILNTDWNMPNLLDVGFMFFNVSKITDLNLQNWQMTNSINMAKMFDHCSNLTNLNVDNWYIPNVTNMYNIFVDCYNLSSFSYDSIANMIPSAQHFGYNQKEYNITPLVADYDIRSNTEVQLNIEAYNNPTKPALPMRVLIENNEIRISTVVAPDRALFRNMTTGEEAEPLASDPSTWVLKINNSENETNSFKIYADFYITLTESQVYLYQGELVSIEVNTGNLQDLSYFGIDVDNSMTAANLSSYFNSTVQSKGWLLHQ